MRHSRPFLIHKILLTTIYILPFEEHYAMKTYGGIDV
jgi:hypothetical protein